MRMEYIAAERTLIRAESLALALNDFDTLSRLYMPLQEARRQRRQRCGEGMVNLRLIARGADDPAIDPEKLIERYPQGQLLIAGWGSIEPAKRFRQLQRERNLYVETFLAAAYPDEDPSLGLLIAVFPSADSPVPPPRSAQVIDRLPMPRGGFVLRESVLPEPRMGDDQTYALVMSFWEAMHAPLLHSADETVDLIEKMDAYRKVIAVDYACEMAHQSLSFAARAYHRALVGRSLPDAVPSTALR